MAVGWISASAILAHKSLGLGRIDDHGADLRLGSHPPVDLRLAEKATSAAAAADLADMEVNLVARHDGLAELGLVDAHEIDELRAIAFTEAVHAQGPGRLREALDDEHAGHDRKARKMALEERLVDGDVLQ